MLDATPLLRLYARYRLNRLAALDPVETQRRTLLGLLRQARNTRFGRDHGFSSLASVEDFQKRVPLQRYEDLWQNYWKDDFPLLCDATWPGRIPYFAVTSGTTSGRTKYIPLSRAMLRSNAQAGADLFVFHLRDNPQSRIMGGKSFMLGGSTALREEAAGVLSGDLSGIEVREMPRLVRSRYFPTQSLARIEDWEEKVDVLANRSLEEDIRMIGGTPSWVLLFFERVAQLTGTERLAGAYPNLEMLVHGGVNFAPYRERFARLLAGTRAEMREVYPASEGFVAVGDRRSGEPLRLQVDGGLFHEFVPVDELESATPTRHWLGNAETGVDYALVLSTCAGLWAYVLGDTVRLVDRAPPRLVVTGRTAQMLSAFGEHVIALELEEAVAAAAHEIGAGVSDFSVGAVVPERGAARGHHIFVVEFDRDVDDADLERFAAVLDRALQDANEDYEAHRTGGFGLDAPRLVAAPAGTFAGWMKRRGQLGGQHKVPRVIADRALLDDLAAFATRSPPEA